jgi:hypothetical protein
MSAPTPRVNSHLLSQHTGMPLMRSQLSARLAVALSHECFTGQQVALVGRVKDCSPDMARVEAADGADVTIKRHG